MRLQQSELAKDYFDEADYRKREQINRALVELSGQGIVEVIWARYRAGEEAERVLLQYAAIDQAYQLTALKPREAKLAEVRDALAPLATHPWEWVRAWRQEADRQLAAKKSAGLQIDKPSLYADLASVLAQLPAYADGVLKRNFSQQVLGDSKRFEQVVERPLLGLLHRYSPDEYETGEQYLDSVGIIANPELTLVAGGLTLQVGEQTLQVSSFPGGCGLSNQTIRECRIASVTANLVLTIENLTTYHSLVSSLAVSQMRDVLCLYTGGFPRKSTQRLLSKLSEHLTNRRKAQPVWHWGDMDYGGIRIFEFQKRNFFHDLQPLLMDVQTYQRYAPGGIPFPADYGKHLRKLLDDDTYSAWRPLVELMLELGVRVEQEGIAVEEAAALVSVLGPRRLTMESGLTGT
jgi:hypothetical protein